MLQYGIVQNCDPGRCQRALVNRLVQPVVPEMIQLNVRVFRAAFDGPQPGQRALQRLRIIGHAAVRSLGRRVIPNLQIFFLRPKSAVPTRTHVAPSSIATSMSFDMPMESSGIE